MSIQINPYISALQETQKAPVSKTQEKAKQADLEHYWKKSRNSLIHRLSDFPSMRQTGCRKEISVFRKVS